MIHPEYCQGWKQKAESKDVHFIWQLRHCPHPQQLRGASAMSAQSSGVLPRRDAQRIRRLELRSTLQVHHSSREYQRFGIKHYFRNGRLELLAMHHGSLAKAMKKFGLP